MTCVASTVKTEIATHLQEVLVRLELASYIVWSTLMLSYTLLSCVAQRSSDRFTHVYLDRGTALFVIILGHLSWAVGFAPDT